MSTKGTIKIGATGKLEGATFAFAGMNFMVDPADLPIEGGQCVDICNCDVDYQANVSRRDGYQRLVAGNITTSWANATTMYCVYLGKICTTDGTYTTPFVGCPDMLPHVEFKQVNDIVVFSDGVTIGLIEQGSLFVFANTAPFA